MRPTYEFISILLQNVYILKNHYILIISINFYFDFSPLFNITHELLSFFFVCVRLWAIIYSKKKLVSRTNCIFERSVHFLEEKLNDFV